MNVKLFWKVVTILSCSWQQLTVWSGDTRQWRSDSGWVTNILRWLIEIFFLDFLDYNYQDFLDYNYQDFLDYIYQTKVF